MHKSRLVESLTLIGQDRGWYVPTSERNEGIIVLTWRAVTIQKKWIITGKETYDDCCEMLREASAYGAPYSRERFK